MLELDSISIASKSNIDNSLSLDDGSTLDNNLDLDLDLGLDLGLVSTRLDNTNNYSSVDNFIEKVSKK